MVRKKGTSTSNAQAVVRIHESFIPLFFSPTCSHILRPVCPNPLLAISSGTLPERPTSRSRGMVSNNNHSHFRGMFVLF